MKNKKCENVEEYLKSLPAQSAKLIKEVKEIVVEVVPQVQEGISYSMPSYFLMDKKKKINVIIFGAYKNHIGFYPTPEVIEVFKEKLYSYKVSKGAIQFPFTKPLPKGLIKEIIEYKYEKIKNVNKVISAGTVHTLPVDIEKVLIEDEKTYIFWEKLTALARNEWICWVEDAKRDKTRLDRIRRLKEDINNGKKRPCCWPGCSHREKKK